MLFHLLVCLSLSLQGEKNSSRLSSSTGIPFHFCRFIIICASDEISSLLKDFLSKYKARVYLSPPGMPAWMLTCHFLAKASKDERISSETFINESTFFVARV